MKPSALLWIAFAGIALGVVTTFALLEYALLSDWWPEVLWAVAIWLGLLCAVRAVAMWLRETRRGYRAWDGRCEECGYDLRGDLSGGCPECGWNHE